MIFTVAIFIAAATAALSVSSQIWAACRILPLQTADAVTTVSCLACLLSCNAMAWTAGGML